MSKENKLLIRFTRFMLEHGIECEEDIYQNDDIDRDSFELIEDLFNIVKSNNSRKDDKQTNADRIRNMSDEELAEWLTNMCDFEKNEELYKSIYNLDTEKEEEIHDSYGDLLKWLQSEAEVIELRDETEIVKQSGVSDDVCEWNGEKSRLITFTRFTTDCGDDIDLQTNSELLKAFRYCPFCGKKIKVAE